MPYICQAEWTFCKKIEDGMKMSDGNNSGSQPGGSGLLDYLLSSYPEKSRNTIKSLLKYGKVLVNGKAVTAFNHQLRPGDDIKIDGGSRTPESDLGKMLKIVYEDHDVIVVEKGSGLLSIGTESEREMTAYSILNKYVKSKGRNNQIFVVHRLDRETSGVMMFVKTKLAKEYFKANWQGAVTEREYYAVVGGGMELDSGTVVSWLKESKSLVMYSIPHEVPDSQKAITHYKVIKKSSEYSLVEVNLETGRKNQIRVHMSDLGHSIIGDRKYGSEIDPIGRIALHARLLEFIHPVSGKKMRFESVVPDEFLRLF